MATAVDEARDAVRDEVFDLEEKRLLNVNEIGLSARTVNWLEEHGILFAGELHPRTEASLLAYDQCGPRRIAEINVALGRLGMCLDSTYVDGGPGDGAWRNDIAAACLRMERKGSGDYIPDPYEVEDGEQFVRGLCTPTCDVEPAKPDIDGNQCYLVHFPPQVAVCSGDIERAIGAMLSSKRHIPDGQPLQRCG